MNLIKVIILLLLVILLCPLLAEDVEITKIDRRFKKEPPIVSQLYGENRDKLLRLKKRQHQNGKGSETTLELTSSEFVLLKKACKLRQAQVINTNLGKLKLTFDLKGGMISIQAKPKYGNIEMILSNRDIKNISEY